MSDDLNDLKLIKKRIFEDGNIKTLLEELGCPRFNDEQHGNLITAQLPPQFDSDNQRAVQVKNNETLTSNIWNRGVKGDIYHVVAHILYDAVSEKDFLKHLSESKKWICETLGYDEYLTYDPNRKKKEAKKDWNGWLKQVKRSRSKEIVIAENRSYNESVLTNYRIAPVQWWIDEGLTAETQTEFEVGFDLRTKRITFPVRNTEGKLIGVKGRYVGDDKYTLDQIKYIYLLPCNKSVELFNLHRALPYIQEKKRVIIVEGAKTTMFLHQWGFPNAVSIEGDKLTPAQMKLLKGLGLDIEFVFAWDKGKEKDFVLEQIAGFKNWSASYIYDEDDLLNESDSPTDRGEKVWKTIYEQYTYKNI